MKIDSSSLKEDVTATVKSRLYLPDEATASEKAAIKAFLEAAIEFGTVVIDHNKIETLENLEQCTHAVSERVELAALLLLGRAVALTFKKPK